MNETKRQYIIKKTALLTWVRYRYVAKVFESVDGGKNFHFCGVEKFCKTKKEAQAYIDQYKKAHAEG